jgi:hypothetical protein
VKLDKSATKTLEMLREVFGEHSSSRTAVFEWHSCFKDCRISVEDDERSGRPGTSKMTMLKKFENSLTKTIAEQSVSSQTLLGSVMELPGDCNRKFEHALHRSFITTMCPPTHP